MDVKRVPGWCDFCWGDVPVFNFPYQEGRWDSIAMTVKKYFVKRCIAIQMMRPSNSGCRAMQRNRWI